MLCHAVGKVASHLQDAPYLQAMFMIGYIIVWNVVCTGTSSHARACMLLLTSLLCT